MKHFACNIKKLARVIMIKNNIFDNKRVIILYRLKMKEFKSNQNLFVMLQSKNKWPAVSSNTQLNEHVSSTSEYL